MARDPIAADQNARHRIGHDLGSTLFVEAGAGSGKTTALVARVVALVAGGEAELSAIAAITFTDKAALELRDRLRRELQEEADRADRAAAARCRVALDELDGAAIGTLHSFAQRILAEHAVEARLPPRLEVLDEVSSGVELDRRWGAFRDRLLADPALERTLLLLFATGVGPSALDALARSFEQQWDLVAERVPERSAEPPTAFALLRPALAAIDEACSARSHCRDATDHLNRRLDDIATYAAGLAAIDDELDLVEALDPGAVPKRPSFRVGNLGRTRSWPDLATLRTAVREAGDVLDGVRDAVADACAHRLGSAIRTFTLESAEERRAAGRLAFHDLLVMARSLLRDPVHGAGVRTRLHQRYRRILLDEFQDTDPIQIELAVRIAAAEPGGDAAGAQRWDAVAVAPGRLFVVGDPKQSIYRFRRADIATFLKARQRFGPGAAPVDAAPVDGGPEGGGLVELTTNFRTGPAIIGWLNTVFARLMGERPDVEVPLPSQPAYVGLLPWRAAPPEGPAVAVLGRRSHPAGSSADEIRAVEAGEVAATVARAFTEGWAVDDGARGWRPARLGDIAVLVPARTSLPFLLDAFDRACIASRAESSSLVYATRPVRDLLMVLRAVDDPTNHLHIVAALRTPLLGCGDDDLFAFRVTHRGRWSFVADQPEGLPDDDPVGRGLAYLRLLHDQRHWRAPSELLDRIARDRRALELGFAEGRPRDVWRRLRFVIDQARAWSEATGGTLRQYLHWVGLQTAEGARVAETILPETDDDAVRILTVHAAKGLEFPVTIVSGLSTAPSGRRAPAEVVFPPTGAVGYRFGSKVVTEEFEAWAPIDEQMGFDERIRLLYVAATRARDHLVVSLHRRTRSAPPRSVARTNAELLVDGMGGALDDLPDAVGAGAATLAVPRAPAPSPPPPFEEWAAERNVALRAAGRPTTVAATALTDEGRPDPAGDDVGAGLRKRARDLDLPPWLKGRYGTAVGRAVHGVLQTVDLATGGDLAAAVAAQCEAEAVSDRAELVGRLVADALGSPSVRSAAAGPHWREVYAATPVGSRLLEGYIDLLYREADGLVVVDYKTTATDDPEELDRRVQRYRLQGASYALAVGAATAEPVARVTFLFLTPGGAVERHLHDLAGAVTTVRRLVEAGEEVTVEDLGETS